MFLLRLDRQGEPKTCDVKVKEKKLFKRNKVFRSQSLTVCDTFVLFCFYFGLIDNGEQKSCNVKVKKERTLGENKVLR